MHKVKAVPQFLFFDEGALVKRLSLRDVRVLAGGPNKAWMQAARTYDIGRLRSAVHEAISDRARGSGTQAQ